ncbi:MAG: hypothetical protein ABTD50_22305 [Polyangiaceae bacterium]|jgi:hypothetical protein
MAKQKPSWFSMLPGGLPPSQYSLDELRSVKDAHAFLSEHIEGPEDVSECVRAFRFLLFFGIACIAEDKHPPLTRCWKDLEKLFMCDPAFEDGVFVESWILMDFPFGPNGQTALDYFEDFLRGSDVTHDFLPFIDAARKSRLGLHQDVMRTKKVAKFRELLSGRVTSALPSVEKYGEGEILLARMMAYKDTVFVFGNPKGFPKETKERLEDMVLDKLFLNFDAEEALETQYEKFMKLAGPYWMSCVTKNEAIPILAPDHYQTYLGRPALADGPGRHA